MTETHRTCSKCKKILPFEEFNFRYREKGIRFAYCRECGKLLTRNHYKNNKKQYLKRNARSFAKRQEFVRNFKSRPCQDCGVQYPYYVMDFDHRENEVKELQINQVILYTIEKLKREIAKCDVVCANCHRERTFQRLNQKLQSKSKKSVSLIDLTTRSLKFRVSNFNFPNLKPHKKP